MPAFALSDGRSAPPAALVRSALLGILVLASLAPVALVEIPALVDYPNHLARMSVLTRAGTPGANPYYEIAWGPYPNLAMDLLVPPLARHIGVELATKLFYIAGQLLIVSGAMALGHAVQRRVVLPAVSACLMLYSVPFAWGFTNFEFGFGLALWFIAAWLWAGPGRPRLRFGVHSFAVAALVISHLFALGVYGLAVGLIELRRIARERERALALARTGAILAAPVAIAALALAAVGGEVGGSETTWWFEGKLTWLFAINGFSRTLSLPLTAALAVLIYVLARNGWLRLAGAGPWLLGGFALVYLLMPFRLFDTAFVDVRVLVAAALVLPAFAVVQIPSPAGRLIARAVVGTVGLINLAAVALVQAEYRREYGTLIAALQRLEPRPRLLVAHAGEAPDPPADYAEYPMYHAATLAVHYADALVPTLFTYPGKQPVATRPEYRRMTLLQGGPIPLALLARVEGTGPVPEPLRFVASWRQDFGYLCIIGLPPGSDAPLGLEPVARGARFTLYRVATATRANMR